MLIEGNALKIRTIRSILVKSGDIGQNFRTLSFSERCFDTQTILFPPPAYFLSYDAFHPLTRPVSHAILLPTYE